MGLREEYLDKERQEWVKYAVYIEEMDREVAKVEWYNKHYVGKYLICEASTWLFVCNVNNEFKDKTNRGGWRDLFTICENSVNKGLWLCKVENYKVDKHGYVNQNVMPVKKITDTVGWDSLFGKLKEGTWGSPAWWLMLSVSHAFIDEYSLEEEYYFRHKPNIEAFILKYPDLGSKFMDSIARNTLEKYICGKISLSEIEDCLNTLSDLDALIVDMSQAYLLGNLEEVYGEKYPLFAKKLFNALKDTNAFVSRVTEDYINRQLESYNALVEDNKMKSVSGGTLDIVEVVLSYRKESKNQKKGSK